MSQTYSIGWDMGAWHTKKKDGICILDAEGGIVGSPSGTALQKSLVTVPNLGEFVKGIYKSCTSETDPELFKYGEIIFAIDAPFAFPKGIQSLINGKAKKTDISGAINNHYLYRSTERFVKNRSGLERNPLSSIQDAIGSQTTKAMHFLNKFKFKKSEPGIWTAKEGVKTFKAIEVYPVTCKVNEPFKNEFKKTYLKATGSWPISTTDTIDALICARLAYLFHHNPERFYQPSEDDENDIQEGWIWFPRKKPTSPSN